MCIKRQWKYSISTLKIIYIDITQKKAIVEEKRGKKGKHFWKIPHDKFQLISKDIKCTLTESSNQMPETTMALKNSQQCAKITHWKSKGTVSSKYKDGKRHIV